ncbi:MAG: LruC domain-containing protein [Phycisphaerae bacterium]
MFWKHKTSTGAIVASLIGALSTLSSVLADCPNSPVEGTFTQLPSVLLDEVRDLLPERVTIFTLHPEFIDETVNPNLLVTQDADISVTFIDEGAGYRNAFGYVEFDNDGNILCEQSIWANASEVGGGGYLVPGDTVDLGTFSAGTNVGFYVIANGFNRGESVPSQSNPDNVFYTIDSLNTDGFRHVALIGTQAQVDGENPLILGFEDLRNLGDKDFNDAVFIVQITPNEAREEIIENGNIPVSDFAEDLDGDGILNGEDSHPDDPDRCVRVRLPGEDENYMIAFEDLFPNVGDGDFNDLVVGFFVEQILDGQGLIKELRIMHKLVARGASYKHEFHHRIRFIGYDATSVTRRYDRAGGLVEVVNGTHNSGADITVFPDTHLALFDETTLSPLPNTEPGKDQKAGRYTETVIIFDNAIPVTDLEVAPFDPYILVLDTGYDIHLIGKNPIDGSINGETPLGNAFVNSAGFPFAMLVPVNWRYPEAGNYIGSVFPGFSGWIDSDGVNNADWYDAPGTGARNYTLTMPD